MIAVRRAAWLIARLAARLAALIAAITPVLALAHGFDERYDLPAPLGYFIAGAAATVLLSFVVAALFARRAPDAGGQTGDTQRIIIATSAPLRALYLFTRCCALALFIITLIAALYGTGDSLMNFAPTFIWIIWWVGLSLLVACVGNIWPALDPWRTLFDATDALAHRLGKSNGIALNWRWPPMLGVWPATALLLLWSWLEVVHPLASVPQRTGIAMLVWSAFTLTGMLCFGRDQWQRHADVFALYFATLGRMAPLAAAAQGQGIVARTPGAALINAESQAAPTSTPNTARTPSAAVPAGISGFIIAMLSTVLFDGLHGGQAWQWLDKFLKSAMPQWLDANGYVAGTIGLLGVWLALLSAYQLTCSITRMLVRVPARTEASPRNPLAPTVFAAPAKLLGELLAPTLVPIAVAYNIAHNFSSLLIQGQNLIPLLSDPLGLRWNLFGTANLHANIGLVDARLTWYVAISAIVVGHVIAVWLAHRVALREYVTPKRAALASIPLTVLMVAYTAISLFAIAEPMVVFEAVRGE